MFCHKFNLLSKFAFFGGISSNNCGKHYFKIGVSGIIVYFKDVFLMMLSPFYYFFLFCCFVAHFLISENYVLFGVNFFSLKFGWCKENIIFHVWEGSWIPVSNDSATLAVPAKALTTNTYLTVVVLIYCIL